MYAAAASPGASPGSLLCGDVLPQHAADLGLAASAASSVALEPGQDVRNIGRVDGAIAPGVVVDNVHGDHVDWLCAHYEVLAPGGTKRLVGASIPFGGMVQPDETGQPATFLASEDVDYTVAQTYNIDGGNRMTRGGVAAVVFLTRNDVAWKQARENRMAAERDLRGNHDGRVRQACNRAGRNRVRAIASFQPRYLRSRSAVGIFGSKRRAPDQVAANVSGSG